MKKQVSRESHSAVAPWQVLYQAALFETNRQMIPGKIAEAESAILQRVKELLQVEADHIEEDIVLDDALYALRALRNCVVGEVEAA
jgi:hypothetical protein